MTQQEPIQQDIQQPTPLDPDRNTRGTPTLIPAIRKVGIDAPFRWLQKGVEDLKRLKLLSLGYGAVMAIISIIIFWSSWGTGSWVMAIAMIGGFFFLGPSLAIGLYSLSRQLQQGKEPQLLRCINEGKKQLKNVLFLSVIFLVIFLIWARAAAMVHIFFPTLGEVHIMDMIKFLLVGSTVGAIFATVVFCMGAFSIPLIMDRETDSVTAVIASIAAVLQNKSAMLVWGFIIVAAILLGVLTGFIGLAVTLPIIGHATWHAYQEVMDTENWVSAKDGD